MSISRSVTTGARRVFGQPWELGLLAIALVAVIAMVGRVGAAAQNGHQSVASADKRLAEAALQRQAALSEGRVDVSGALLISFTSGLTLHEALEVVRQTAPNATPTVITYQIEDSSGIIHTIGSFVSEGEDPAEKAPRFLAAQVESIRGMAAARLVCTVPEVAGTGESLAPDCAPETHPTARKHLEAQANLDLAAAVVRSIQVQASETDAISAYKAVGDKILTVEQILNGRVLGPVLPSEGDTTE
ncbi:MAG: hypothetical protein LC118_08735 [Dehalococcoidia bacterium]|nr:hypothetical protein [Dehalococcoidia bacterium]